MSQGELATLTESQKQTLLQNAALIDQQKIREQLAAYEVNLADANASARASNQAELTGYGQGSRMRERMQEMLRIREEFQQKNVDLQRQYQSGDISEELYRQELDLNKRYLAERLRDQQGFYAASDAQRSDWTAGMREGFANWADTASDYASQSADLVNNAMTGLVGNISDALSGNKVDWEDWASSVLQSMQKIILNAMLVDSLRATSNSGFSVQSAVCLGLAQALYLAVLRPALTTQQRQDFNLTQKVAPMLLQASAHTVTASSVRLPILHSPKAQV